jgi:hypothetical protein
VETARQQGGEQVFEGEGVEAVIMGVRRSVHAFP